jgi:serine hydrolase
VIQDEWEAPACASWVARLDIALDAAATPVVLAAHSAGCAMVAHWVAGADSRNTRKVKAALLVAPSDPASPNYPRGPSGFAPVPRVRLPFASIVVASDDDPYVSPERAREYAAAWGSRLVMLPGAGHINVASGHGPWPEGFELLASLRRAAEHVAA